MTQWGSGWPADNGTFGSPLQPFSTPPDPSPPSTAGSRWPLIALVVGICALAVALFPAGIGFVAIPVGIFGIVAGVLGLQAAQREGRGAGSAITGIVVSVLAMALAAVMFFIVYRTPAPAPASAAPTTTTSKKLAPATVIPENNYDIQSVLKDEVDVSFGPYSDDGGDFIVRDPLAEMTVVSKRDIPRTCRFTVRAVDGAGAEIRGRYLLDMRLNPGTTARENIFSLGQSSIKREDADRLRTGTFEVTKASCSPY
ncbi:hypothetical protein A5792_14890 [Mycolicibacterium peregrinum]|uniref:DUF4190 domain-containing protein n=1 Tax=Mycolicibacterium peregrinum TaxID=43304 RepID=A0A1A0RBU9_MYCPR|nr:DUF4190 domain-containing protein [Mycolicibacterium peregrinum]OBB31965.1 hypothetical protein A5792_14890 [Mycolicibacterium peregrinum]